MTEPKEQAVPVVGVEEAVERLTSDLEGCPAGDDVVCAVSVWAHDLRTILQALQGSQGSLAGARTHRATEQPVVGEWHPMAEAPKDGREVEALVIHVNATLSADAWGDGWVSVVRAKWIDHNGGGWTWNGLCGVLAAWRKADRGEAALGGDDAKGGVNQDLQAQLKAAYEALEEIEKAATLVSSRGATTGPQWSSLSIALINARQALARRGEG